MGGYDSIRLRMPLNVGFGTVLASAWFYLGSICSIPKLSEPGQAERRFGM